MFLFIAALCGFAPSSATSAQEPYSPLVPRGSIRLDARGFYSSFSHLLGVEAGTGGRTARLSDAFSGIAGARTFPFLGAAESSVNEILEDPYTLSLGSMVAAMEKNTAMVPLAVDVGVFDWLTVGVSVPLVGSETEFSLFFGAEAANAGFSPTFDNEVLVTGFMNQLQGSIVAYDGYREVTCQTDPDSPECTGAIQVLRDARSFESALALLYGEMFVPLSSSSAGAALQARLADLNLAFEAAGLGGPAALPLAAAALTTEDFQRLVTDPRYGIAASYPLGTWRSAWRLGDVEVRADARLAETGEPGATTRITAGAGATVRLPTGSRDDPANFLDVGSGDGQWDVELRGWMNGRWTRGLGLWADLRYGVQIGGTTERRVFDPDITFAPASSQTMLDWNPGDYQRIELTPWLRISDGLTGLAGFSFFRKGEDSFSVREGDPAAAPPADPSILVPGTGVSASQVLLGMVYNRAAGEYEGIAGDPLEIRAVYRRVVGGSGGAVPRETSLEVGFRVFRSIWGG